MCCDDYQSSTPSGVEPLGRRKAFSAKGGCMHYARDNFGTRRICPTTSRRSTAAHLIRPTEALGTSPWGRRGSCQQGPPPGHAIQRCTCLVRWSPQHRPCPSRHGRAGGGGLRRPDSCRACRCDAATRPRPGPREGCWQGLVRRSPCPRRRRRTGEATLDASLLLPLHDGAHANAA